MVAHLEVSPSAVLGPRQFVNYDDGIWENRYPTDDWICLAAFLHLYGQPRFELAPGDVLFEPNPAVAVDISQALHRSQWAVQQLPVIGPDICSKESVMYARLVPYLMRCIHKKGDHAWSAELAQDLEVPDPDPTHPGGKVDVAMLLSRPNPDAPGRLNTFLPCFLELKPGEQKTSQSYQTLAEGLLACKRNGHYDVPILGGVLTCRPPQVKLWCFVKQSGVLVQVYLGRLSLETVDGVNQLIDLLAFWTSMVARRLDDRQIPRREESSLKYSRTLIFKESEEKKMMVFKAFRRDNQDASFVFNLEHIPEAKQRAESDHFVVIEYPYIPAVKAMPSSSKDFVGVLQDLQRLNQAGLVHGDIRLANMIFAQDRSHLIDYDFCGQDQKSCYPSGYNLSLEDTLRHPDLLLANDNPKLMRQLHDWYSMSAIMGAFEPSSANDAQRWKDIRRLVLQGKLAEAIDQINSSEMVLPSSSSKSREADK